MNTTLIAITGPSGFHKSELLKEAIKRDADFTMLPAYTDAKPKDNEEHKLFKFISEKEFDEMIDAEKFLEWQRLLSNNHRYGKTKEDFERVLNENSGKIIFTLINIINLPLLKRHYPAVKSIFVDVKDTQTLIDFLKNSPDVTDDEEFEKRFKFATEERRRRHLADVTMHMADDMDESYRMFMDAVKKLAN